ncbi:MAG: diadenylate cyclase [Mariprofundaceae bacterium]|nr:diadenylate cyclase [Mariprofundaceae bacterium]
MLIDSIQLSFIDILDITLVALMVYWVLRLIRGTHAEQMLIGLLIMFTLYEISRLFGLLTVEWIFNQIFAVFIVLLVILFQSEIRKGLVRVAKNPLSTPIPPQEQLVNTVVQAANLLVKKGWGALIVFEREAGLKHLDESGVLLHARVDVDLILTLFCPETALHDGAIVLAANSHQQPEIRSARVLLPLAKSTDIHGQLGTRHRAAIGLSEENDALVLIVSEERGEIHIVEDGQMSMALQSKDLTSILQQKLAHLKVGEDA